MLVVIGIGLGLVILIFVNLVTLVPLIANLYIPETGPDAQTVIDVKTVNEALEYLAE